MTRLKEADAPLVPSSWLRDWLQPKINFECALKNNKNSWSFEKFFHVFIKNNVLRKLIRSYRQYTESHTHNETFA